MEASKCPKCGDEPHFVEHMEKWYCYGCNSYVEDEAEHVEEPQKPAASPEAIASELKALEEEDKAVCRNCGAELESIKDGKLFCFVCEAYPEDVKPEVPPQLKEEEKINEAQALLESAAKLEVVEAKPEAIPIPVPVSIPVPEPEPEPPPEPKKETLPEIKMCSVCGQPLKWIEKYQRHYCYGCRKYAQKEGREKAVVTTKTEDNGHKNCPECGKELRFIEKYHEYYCFACKSYPLRTRGKAAERTPAPPGNGIMSCPKCGDPLKLVEKYQRHYCYTCKEYAPKGSGQTPKEKKMCPACKEEMKFVSEYNEWYCYKCKKYSLRPNKPILLV